MLHPLMPVEEMVYHLPARNPSINPARFFHPMNRKLITVARHPIPGKTKTRLSPPLSQEQTANLYECFLLDTLEIMRQVPGVERVLAYLPEDARDYFNRLAPDMALIPQRGASLGERLDNLLNDTLLSGYEQCIAINSDGPSLPVEYLVSSFTQLESCDVVLGPTLDGGYYLIGMKHPHSRLVLDVQMSTPRVLADTLDLASQAGLTTSLLPTWYDVDTYADLDYLYRDLSRLPPGTATHTRQWFITSGHFEDLA